MGWLARLLGASSKEEMEGIRLNRAEAYWEVDGPATFTELLNALRGWVPEGCILYFEGGSADDEIKTFLHTHSVPEVCHVAMGTIWPRPQVHHVPATDSVLAELAEIMDHHAEPELAVHFHIYRGNTVLLEWHDAFADPLSISGVVAEHKVKVFAEKTGQHYSRVFDQSTAAKDRRAGE